MKEAKIRRPSRQTLNPTPAASNTVAKNTVEGGLLGLTSNGVVGWARNMDDPAQAVQVVLLVNDIVSDKAMANRFDLEMVRTRVGPGIPGFVMTVRRPNSKDYPLRLTLRDLQGRSLGTPIIISDADGLEHFVEPVSASYEGIIDGIWDGMLLGWARSLTDPDVAVVVELHDGTERIGRQVAQNHRADLATAGKRNGLCSFAFELPITLLDGNTHSLHVTVAGTEFEVGNSPIHVGQLSTSKLLKEVTQLRDEVARLRKLVETVTSSDGKLQTELVRTLHERVAAFSDIQRDLVERELDVLRAVGAAEIDPSHRSTRSRTKESKARR